MKARELVAFTAVLVVVLLTVASGLLPFGTASVIYTTSTTTVTTTTTTNETVSAVLNGTHIMSSRWAVNPRWVNGSLILNMTFALPAFLVSLYNSQNISTPSPFVAYINITKSQLAQANPSLNVTKLWSTAVSNHFLNVLFKINGVPAYAWVMNYTNNWVAVWVKLPSGIPKYSTANLTLAFTGQSQYPYTGVYADIYSGYDNGNDVFPLYAYFYNTLPSGWEVVVWQNPNGVQWSPGPSTGGYMLQQNNGYYGDFIYYTMPSNFTSGNYTLIVSWYYSGSADALIQELFGNVSHVIQASSIGSTDGGYTPFAYGGIGVQNEFYASQAYIKNSTTSVTLPFNGQGTYYVVTWFGVQGNNTEYYGYSLVGNWFDLAVPSSFKVAHDKVGRTSPTVMIGFGDYGDTAYCYVDTVIVIPTPPNMVFPEASLSTPVEPDQYIAWFYRPPANATALNITVKVSSLSVASGTSPGLVILSDNAGNYTEYNITAPFYGLLISYTGSIWYHAPNSTFKVLKSSVFTVPKAPFTMTVSLVNRSGNVSISKVYINGTAYTVNLTTPFPWSKLDAYIGETADTNDTVTSSAVSVQAVEPVTITTTTTSLVVASTTVSSSNTSTTTSTTTTTPEVSPSKVATDVAFAVVTTVVAILATIASVSHAVNNTVRKYVRRA
jgi:hypothetical protein